MSLDHYEMLNCTSDSAAMTITYSMSLYGRLRSMEDELFQKWRSLSAIEHWSDRVAQLSISSRERPDRTARYFVAGLTECSHENGGRIDHKSRETRSRFRTDKASLSHGGDSRDSSCS